MNEFVDFATQGALITLVILILATGYHAIRSKSLADRFLAVDLIITLLIGVIIIIAIIDNWANKVDLGIALAALSFISKMSITQFVKRRKVF